MILKWNKTWYRFLRQKPIESYIIDFYCPKLKLAIEIDGISHEGKSDYDKKRDKEISLLWIKTIRYRDEDITKKLEAVSTHINIEIEKREEQLRL